MSVILDPAGGYAHLGPVQVPIRLNSRNGTLQINGENGPVVRPLTFSERTRLMTYARMSPNPRQASGKLVVEAALQHTAPADPLILAIMAMVLAGGSESDLPSYSETALLLSQMVGWSPAQFGETQALEVDQLVKQLVPPLEDGWTRLVFSRETGRDLQAIYDNLADNLLGRTQPRGLAQNIQSADANKPFSLSGDMASVQSSGKVSQPGQSASGPGAPANFQEVGKISLSSETTPDMALSNSPDSTVSKVDPNQSSTMVSQMSPKVPLQVAQPGSKGKLTITRQDASSPKTMIPALDRESGRSEPPASSGGNTLPGPQAHPKAAPAPLPFRDQPATVSKPLMPAEPTQPSGNRLSRPENGQSIPRIPPGSQGLQDISPLSASSLVSKNPWIASGQLSQREKPMLPPATALVNGQTRHPFAFENNRQSSPATLDTTASAHFTDMARLLQAVDLDIDEVVAEIGRRLQLEADLRGINR